MRIECLIRRANGSTVTMDAVTYRFLPDAQGRHVADIQFQEHVTRLLALPDGFRAVPEPIGDPAPVSSHLDFPLPPRRGRPPKIRETAA